jgi:hypothetical protein
MARDKCWAEDHIIHNLLLDAEKAWVDRISGTGFSVEFLW